MTDQIGFDFGQECLPAVLVEDPPGSWTTPEFTTGQYETLFERAGLAMPQIFAQARPLFESGLQRVRAVHAQLQDHRKSRDADAGDRCYRLWRTDIEVDALTLQAFIQHCQSMIDGNWDSPETEYKQRQDVSHRTVAMYCTGVGSVIVRIWDADNIAVDFVLGKDTFFLKSYRDEEHRMMASECVFEGQGASQPLSESGDKIAALMPFSFEGREYIKTRATYSARIHSCNAWTFCARSDWRGPTYSYRDLIQTWDDGRKQRGDCRGLMVRVRGQEVVLNGYVLFVDERPGELKPPETN